jgi:hypothetical protein
MYMKTVPMKRLSSVYKHRKGNRIYGIAYDTGFGTIEMVAVTFPSFKAAKQYAKTYKDKYLGDTLYVVDLLLYGNLRPVK